MTNNKNKILEILNKILELELAGVIRYTHYSLMIFGYNRIPIVNWFREQSAESLRHAEESGEMITHLGGHPSLKIGDLLETYNHNISDILEESLNHEEKSLNLYKELMKVSDNNSIFVREYAVKMIVEEENHIGEVDKMLRKEGDHKSYNTISNL